MPRMQPPGTLSVRRQRLGKCNTKKDLGPPKIPEDQCATGDTLQATEGLLPGKKAQTFFYVLRINVFLWQNIFFLVRSFLKSLF